MNKNSFKNSDNDIILATGGYDNSIRFWSVHSGNSIRVIPQIEPHINAMEITPDRLHLAVASYQHIKFFDVQCKNLTPLVNFRGLSKNVTCIGFNDTGRWMFSGGEDGLCRIWDLKKDGEQIKKICSSKSAINTAALHPKQNEIYFGDQNGYIYIWDLRADRKRNFLVDNDIAINHLSIEPEGDRLACVDNKGNCYTFSLNAKYANCQKENSIEVEPLQRKIKFKAHKRYALKCKFSPDSTLLATTSADQSAKIWRTADLLLLNERQDGDSNTNNSNQLNTNWPIVDNISYLSNLTVANQRWVWDVAFSADSQYVITASSDGIARLWNVETGDVKREYSGHQRAITSLAFSDSLID